MARLQSCLITIALQVKNTIGTTDRAAIGRTALSLGCHEDWEIRP